MQTELPQLADDCGMILSAIATTSSILSNSLSLAKWESGAFPVHKASFPLVRLLQAVVLFGQWIS